MGSENDAARTTPITVDDDPNYIMHRMKNDGLAANVRLIEDSYEERWPSALQQYGMHGFGPVRESFHIYLPLSATLAKLTPDKQWGWLRDPANSFEANNMLATWGSIYSRERGAMSARLRAAVIERVNEAMAAGLIKAPKRDPQTGRVAA